MALLTPFRGDSGPVAVFYRRDFYEKAGVDPATIKTWDDFIAAGKKVMEANPGVVMTQADFNGDSEWFRMISNEQGLRLLFDRWPVHHHQSAGLRCDAREAETDEGCGHHHRRDLG